ncbi:MAG: hypothetical protein P8J86_02680 [Phycisphaerales bacterium]|nr:hypothetical protein [Phycisphaerales bacterium]
MTFTFNVIIIGIVLLIGYWWANQGLLSSLLHLTCVIVAGAITIAVWEPITLAILSGGWFDNYAWGAIFLACFAVFLGLARSISDQAVKANIFLPPWANMTFGFVCGALSGIITVGMIVIGTGFFQTADSIIYPGWGRDRDARAIVEREPKPWLPVAKWTVDFYEYTSLGSLYPNISGAPLARQYPSLDRQASLVRDSFGEGKGQLSLAPDGATVSDVFKLKPKAGGTSMEFESLAQMGILKILIDQLKNTGAARSDIRILERIQADPQAAPSLMAQMSPELQLMLSAASGSGTQRYLGKPRNDQSTLIVLISFGSDSIDFGEQLTLSQAQVRLICHERDGSASKTAEVIFPYGWGQSVTTAPFANFIFDSQTYYVTSVPGREAASVAFSFIVPNDLQAKFIQIRGTRYNLDSFEDRQTGQFPAISDFEANTKIIEAFQPQAPPGFGFGGPPSM